MGRANQLCEAFSIAGSDKMTMVEMLSKYLADLYVMYTKTLGFHWNVTGPRFHDLHKDFGAQYEALEEMIDPVAERVRALEGFPPGSLQGMLNLATVEEATTEVPSANMMIETVARDFQFLADSAREINRMATEINDEATIDLVGGQVEVHEKFAWMMKSSL